MRDLLATFVVGHYGTPVPGHRATAAADEEGQWLLGHLSVEEEATLGEQSPKNLNWTVNTKCPGG